MTAMAAIPDSAQAKRAGPYLTDEKDHHFYSCLEIAA